MSEVDAIDSAGLGELVIIYTAAGQQRCRICPVNPSAQIVRLLDTTRLRAMLPDFRDAELAFPGATRRSGADRGRGRRPDDRLSERP
jgi:anti-anti-sigma regulatory factor